MSTINSCTFNAGSGGVAGVYSKNDPIVATVVFTPDSPTNTPVAETLTLTLTPAGTVSPTDTQQFPFTVNTPNPVADTLAAQDSGGRTWTLGAAAANTDGTETETASATA